MKFKIFYIMALVFLAFSCENAETSFEDFKTQAVYFPIQYPVRTISLLEDSRIENSIDLQKSFNIGVSLGGVRDNRIERKVIIELAPELVSKAFFGASSNTVKLMPSNYYSLSSNEITIPVGSFSGNVRVNLTDAFFNDPLATSTNYVIPLVIKSASVNILSGKPNPSIANPDRRIATNWEPGSTPKDYTLFAVKFINKIHGKYLVKGVDRKVDASGNQITKTIPNPSNPAESLIVPDLVSYNTKFIEQNKLTDLFTLGLNKSTVAGIGNLGDSATQRYEITVSDDGNVLVSTASGALAASGTGKLIKRNETGAQVWGGESRKTFILNYSYVDAAKLNHRVTDTLVFRNDELKFEEFTVTVK